MKNDLPQFMDRILRIVRQVGSEIKTLYEQYQRDTILEIQAKADDSPITEVDLISHELITTQLKALMPECPILSEETSRPPFAERQSWQRYWLLDPLDGTREFIDGLSDFVINLALIEQDRPIVGIIYAPVTEVCYFAYRDGKRAYKQQGLEKPRVIHTRAWQPGHTTVVVSRRHGTSAIHPFLDKVGDCQMLSLGSALKFGLIAEGAADIYLRMSPTSEWDTAAGQCIVEMAGGFVVDEHWQPMRYNTKDALVNPNFFVLGDSKQKWLQCFSRSF